MSADIFYTYALMRETGVPFYIGKGKGDRWDHHERQARAGIRDHRCAIIRDMQSRGFHVIKLKIHEGLTEAVAHEYEIALIKAVGRGRNGPLVNLTDGGEGITGFRFPPGKKLSAEHVAKRSAARRGKKLSAESRANIGARQRGRKKSPEE
ncbi:MAG TPA: GIY-YIG nuclease family protein, partial [Mycobacterium sp.]